MNKDYRRYKRKLRRSLWAKHFKQRKQQSKAPEGKPYLPGQGSGREQSERERDCVGSFRELIEAFPLSHLKNL